MREKVPASYDDGYEPKATPHEINKYMQSAVYADFVEWIAGRICHGRDELEDPNMELSEAKQAFKRGYVYAMRHLEAYFEMTLEDSKERLKEKLEDEKDARTTK